ncbi:uncharacterized protein VNE69_11160 [Vairimorpha necatrix]|uniref:Uncharacterized protein n=1 Tax=Vairimorpha necatrix TaxID=6039 RepID=A0AAX4JGH1_9MICR
MTSSKNLMDNSMDNSKNLIDNSMDNSKNLTDNSKNLTDNKKNLTVLKVGGRRVIKKINQSHNILKDILDNNKKSIGKSIVDELSIERNSKIYKYKNNIKIVFDDQNKPIGFLVSGFPEIKTKIVKDPPMNFEEVVESLNKEFMGEMNEIEEYLDIE